MKIHYIYSGGWYTSDCFKGRSTIYTVVAHTPVPVLDKSATYTVVAAALVTVLKEGLQKHNSLGITPALLNEQDKSKRGRSTAAFPQRRWQAAKASSLHHFPLPPTWLMSVSHSSVKSLFSLLCKGKRRDGESSEVNKFFLLSFFLKTTWFQPWVF